ncbi:MAG: isocitrate/isopropylmalate dehydrogenase family protein [Bryobacteraceae bacterium]
MKIFNIAVLPGDGIGPDVIREGVGVLRAVERRLEGVRFDLCEFSVGAGEYLRGGDPLPEATFEECKSFDAILLGAMGLPDVRWPNGTEMAPQLDLRERLELYAGVRPIYLYNPIHSPLRSYGSGEIDFVIFRENTEGMFASRKGTCPPDADEVCDTLRITRLASERLFRAAFREAERRRGLVTLIDKANVLPSMAFFRRVFDHIAEEFPKVTGEKIYVDASALYLVQNPRRFDVIVSENLFGDILSDLAAGLIGGMGMAPSGDIGDRHAVFQPSHGSAPDIAGLGIANPVATVLSVAMMLDWLPDEETRRGGALVRSAVQRVLAEPGCVTRDLGGSLSTGEMGARIAEEI